MTTIAYDGRYIACDGRSSIGGVVSSDSTDKSYIVGDSVFFLCGSVEFCIKFSEYFVEGMECSIPGINSGGFLFKDDVIYLVFVDEETKRYRKDRIRMDYWADGSGRDWAIAAMDHGKDAIDAVKYAMTRDTGSGGKITCYDTKTKKFIKVKQ